MDARAPAARRKGRVRDRAVVLLVLGVVLWLPPLCGASLVEGRILGLPVPLFYIFAVWALLILGTVLLARPLAEASGDEGRR
jgi:hypothetical protein